MTLRNISIDEGTDMHGRFLTMRVTNNVFLWAWPTPPDGKWNALWEREFFFVDPIPCYGPGYDNYLYAIDLISDTCHEIYGTKLPYEQVRDILKSMAVQLKLRGCV
jgi:hypothetical protein